MSAGIQPAREKNRSAIGRTMASVVKDQLRGFAIVLPSAISLGVALRFWRAVFATPPYLAIDWTPAVYWIIGIVCSAIAVQIAWKDREVLPVSGRIVLVSADGSCLA